MQIAYLGMGTWGYCLASLLAAKGYRVKGWTTQPQIIEHIRNHGEHPRLPGYAVPPGLSLTTDLAEALTDCDLIVESVTSAGVRPVLRQVKELLRKHCPFVLTSKGIEQDSRMTLPAVAVEVLGEWAYSCVALLSGPSFAQEVVRGLPTSVVLAAYAPATMLYLSEVFTTQNFRVYPNEDIAGVAYGGALKNVIAIACGIADGLSLGYGCSATLITRGLHEMRKLAVAGGCRAETLNGLSGMGDLCLTCSSPMSRNYRFGYLLAQGCSSQKALEEITVVVEGAYTCVSALQLGKQWQVPLPITELVYKIIYEGLSPHLAVEMLMQRTVKWEHL
jgi:glycerol-3-phosphate dehydrogenase (NAD(P)+)